MSVLLDGEESLMEFFDDLEVRMSGECSCLCNTSYSQSSTGPKVAMISGVRLDKQPEFRQIIFFFSDHVFFFHKR